MKAKRLSIICAYLGFFLGAISLFGKINYIWWIIINLIVFFTYFNHLRWKIYFSSFFTNSLVLLLIVFCLLMPSSGTFEVLLRILFVLCMVKFITPLRPRDLWQIYTLNLFLFCMASICRYELEFGLLIFLFLYITLTGICFLTAEQFTDTKNLKKYLLYFSSFFSLIIIIIATLFFIALPRSPYAFLWGLGLSSKAKTGFSERINLKVVQEIREDKGVAFRAIMSKRLSNFPYWRGIVYDTYKNGHWQTHIPTKGQKFVCPSNSISQVIFLEPYEGKMLIGMEYPISITIIAPKKSFVPILNTLIVRMPHQITTRLEYKVKSCPICPSSFLEEEKKLYLQVPQDVKIRLKDIIKKLIKPKDSSSVIVEKLIDYLKSPQFHYSSRVYPSQGDPILQFLFSTHRGWCEHFSSALTLLLRTANVPARLVGGYYGGRWNKKGNYYLVLQKDAHTWVEYWDGKTWKRADPTPAKFTTKENPLFSSWIDYIRLRWYAYVINYDFSMQKRLFLGLKHVLTPKKIGYQIKHPELRWGKWLFLGLALLVVMFFLHSLLRYKRKTFIMRLQMLLRNYGYSCESSQGGLEWAENIAERDQKLSYLVRKFVLYWYHIHYGRKEMDGETKTFLNRLLKEIKNYLKQNYK